ncbi:MAG: glycoside hydrolase, partial [uncultured Gemmatimonadaceae bacterium]
TPGRAGDAPAPEAAPPRARRVTAESDTVPVRALYVNRFAAQSTRKLARIIGYADSTEVNALVIDMKDEFGLNYVPADAGFARNAGAETKLRSVKALVDTLRAHDILPIARLVVFKDSVTARVHPEWTIRRADGAIWRDHKGLAWVNPYHRALWDYNVGVAEELVRLGFGEIQFDYIRFPEPYKSLPQQVFADSKGQSKPDAIAEFLKVANARLDKLGVRTTADIFGLVTTVGGPLEVAQHWEKLSPVTDVLLPMVYPSHYPRGSYGIARPNAEPYRVVNVALSRARERDEALGIRDPRHVRPYLQAFTLGAPAYGAPEVAQQIRATYDAGYDGWVLWHPGSNYEPFVGAFARTLESKASKAPIAAKPRGD